MLVTWAMKSFCGRRKQLYLKVNSDLSWTCYSTEVYLVILCDQQWRKLAYLKRKKWYHFKQKHTKSLCAQHHLFLLGLRNCYFLYLERNSSTQLKHFHLMMFSFLYYWCRRKIFWFFSVIKKKKKQVAYRYGNTANAVTNEDTRRDMNPSWLCFPLYIHLSIHRSRKVQMVHL